MRIFHGIGDEVGDGLRHPAGIDRDPQTVVGIVFQELHPRLLHPGAQRLEQLVERLGEIHLDGLDGHLSCLERRGGQDVVDQAQQHVTVVLDNFHHLLLLLRRRQGGQHLREAHDGVDGRTDLVGHIGQEETLHLSRLPGTLRLTAQLVLLAHQVADITPDTKGTQQPPVLVVLRDTVDLHPLHFVGTLGHRRIHLPDIDQRFLEGLGGIRQRLHDILLLIHEDLLHLF